MSLGASPEGYVKLAHSPLAPINSVLYECNKTSIHLAVKIDPLGNGLLLDPQLVHLGSCLYSIDDGQGFLHFQYRLKDCGFSRLVSENLSWGAALCSAQ